MYGLMRKYNNRLNDNIEGERVTMNLWKEEIHIYSFLVSIIRIKRRKYISNFPSAKSLYSHKKIKQHSIDFRLIFHKKKKHSFGNSFA